MNTILIALGTLHLLAVLLLLVLLCLACLPWLNARSHRRHGRIALANDNLTPKTHENSKTFKADGALSRYLLLKLGSDADHVTTAGAADCPVGNSDDAPDAAEYSFAVALFGLTNRTRIVIASEAIAAGADVYTAASGKVQDLPVAAGTYWHVGRAVLAAGADGDKMTIIPKLPSKLVVS